MADVDRSFTYDKAELRRIIQSFKAMDDEAIDQAKKMAGKLAEHAADEIKKAARTAPNSKVASRVADGVKISKTSKIGDFSFGFASQKFSGGGTTQMNPPKEGGNGLLAGVEFGSKRFKQFAPRTARFGKKGNEGYFIFPTLRRIQPDLVKQWEMSFSEIVGKF